MKCEEFINNLDNISHDAISQGMKDHIVDCDDCRDYYSVISALKPAVCPETPKNIKMNVLSQAKRKEQFKAFITMKTKLSRIAATAAAVVAIALSIIMVGSPNPARAAEKIIDKSLANVGSVKSMVMKIDVRTRFKDNLASIDLNEQMVAHTLTVLRGDQTKWRLDKGWRCIVFDGKTKYMWTPDNVMTTKGTEDTGFEEWFEILIDPEMTLMGEKAATEDKGTEYSIKKSDHEIILTADVKAKGDFANPYCRNTSIATSDTRREIVFDKQTNLIKSMKIYVKDNSREILVVDVKYIEYNTPVNEAILTSIPQGIEWRDVNAPVISSGKFTGITPEAAAKMIFAALENNNLESAKDAFVEFDIRKMDKYRGIKVIKLGESFKSGLYSGVFVPYEIEMPDGTIKKHNIALRNDNANKEWHVDGGI